MHAARLAQLGKLFSWPTFRHPGKHLFSSQKCLRSPIERRAHRLGVNLCLPEVSLTIALSLGICPLDFQTRVGVRGDGEEP